MNFIMLKNNQREKPTGIISIVIKNQNESSSIVDNSIDSKSNYIEALAKKKKIHFLNFTIKYNNYDFMSIQNYLNNNFHSVVKQLPSSKTIISEV